MSLYECLLTFNVVVEAENHKKAMEIAKTYIGEEIDDNSLEPLDTRAKKITRLNQLPENWENAIPWNTDDDKTCTEILAENKLELVKCKNCGKITGLGIYNKQIICTDCFKDNKCTQKKK